MFRGNNGEFITHLWFGKQIHDTANQAVSNITNKFNPVWKRENLDVIPSGATNMAANIMLFQEKLWESTLVATAKSRLESRASSYERKVKERASKGGSSNITKHLTDKEAIILNTMKPHLYYDVTTNKLQSNTGANMDAAAKLTFGRIKDGFIEDAAKDLLEKGFHDDNKHGGFWPPEFLTFMYFGTILLYTTIMYLH